LYLEKCSNEVNIVLGNIQGKELIQSEILTRRKEFYLNIWLTVYSGPLKMVYLRFVLVDLSSIC